MQDQRITVLKLRAVGGSVEPMGARLALGTVLDNASLHPTRLPPPAAVFIRKLRDPLPGSLELGQRATRRPLEWERALAASIDHLVSIAAHPALEPVPASAEAVIFLDRSELLACLASDWIDGSAISRWWWRSLFRASDVTTAVAREWLTSIEYVPAAFAKLAQKGNAIKFAGSLPQSVVGRLLDEITRNFGLTNLRSSLSHSKFERQPPTTGLSDHSKRSTGKLAKPLTSRELTELRTRLAPEAFATRLNRDARVLLVVALMLERAPSVLRERNFSERLMASLPATGTTEGIDIPTVIEQSERELALGIERSAADEDNRTEQRLTHQPPEGQAHNDGFPATTSGEKHQFDYRVQQDEVRARDERGRKTEPVRVTPRDLRAALKSEDRESIVSPVETPIVIGETRASEVRREIPFQQPDVTAAPIEVVVETKLGGVFYLINAALALNLYSDFTQPLDPGIELSIWDFLALTGRDLNGKLFKSDPISTLLARLAGRREGEQPGSHFSAPEEWRLPPDWLDAFPEPGDWSYQTSRGRLIVRHPDDFTVLSVKLGPRFRAKDIAARLANETCCYSTIATLSQRRFVRDGFGLRERERRLERWTRWITAYLRARLARAVGIVPSGELVATTVFSYAARVEVTPARVDVFFSLAELPVEVRLSGLDRDPGWVPAAGRSIAFHFD